ncbi:MAG: SEC-C domain-containing protein [Gaiellaceae bacterium]
MSVAAPTVPRNRPCPCGSGRKHKLCCGTTRTEEREHQHRQEALTAAAHFAVAVPLARPTTAEFDAWADRVARSGGAVDEEENGRLLDEGRDVLAAEERERVVEAVRRALPSLCDELEESVGAEALAEAILMGAVVAGVNERVRAGDTRSLWLIEDDSAERGPAEVLSLGLDPGELWNAAETQRLDDALNGLPYDDYDDDDPELDRLWNRTVAAMAKRMATPAHQRRLQRLVGYLRARLPIEGYPKTSGALMVACEIFERDKTVRARTAALLLADTL